MRRTIVFWLCAGLSLSLCHFLAIALLPGSWSHAPQKPRDFQHEFLAVYQDFGLDYYILRFGLFGVDRNIQEADVICSSSSKGLYGFDPELLSQHLSTPERPIRVFNLSFGFGEGFGYLMEVVKTLDLHDKTLIADLTDNTCSYHFTPMAHRAMQTSNTLDAYKIVFERWMSFTVSNFLSGRAPRIGFDANRGFVVADQSVPYACRAWENGRMERAIAQKPLYPEPGRYPFPFDPDGKLKDAFFEECARRNIRIVFTSIPYQGYDEAWGRKVAGELGYTHLAVDPSGIDLIDPTHMAATGRQVFSERLGQQLRQANLFGPTVQGAQRPTLERR